MNRYFPRHNIDMSIIECFLQQVQRAPTNPAVKTPEKTWSYKELDLISDQIAWAVLEQGGTGAEPVAIFLEQGGGAVASILGVLKAGKFYLPLEPLEPVAHNRELLQDSGIKLLLYERKYRELVHEIMPEGCLSLYIDELGRQEKCSLPRVTSSADSLVYLFYTSGSTGRPKAVYDNHRNVLHNIMRYSRSLKITAADKLTLIQSPAFSGTVSSIFSALLNGACLLPFDFRQHGADGLATWLKEVKASIYHSVPAIFRRVICQHPIWPDLRLIRLEGDRATELDVLLYRQHCTESCVLVNGLGTTETGICRQYFIDKDTDIGAGLLPVGYAVEDMQVSVLDEAGVPVEPGVVGEIAVSSPYLCLGYWQQPELTAASFRCNDNRRTYRTGDLGCMDIEGKLSYLGRKNFQHKILGNRIDPALIESCLLQFYGVHEALVASVDRSDDSAVLCAYLVFSSDVVPEVGQIQTFLHKRLPAYMVPSIFYQLEQLPVSSSYKLDRRKLAELPAKLLAHSAAFLSPSTPLEQFVAALWCEVLKLECVGRSDHFFALGGESLKGTQVLVRLRDVLEVDIPLRMLFEQPVLTDFCRTLELSMRDSLGAADQE